MSPKPRAETASTGLVPPHESSTHTDRAVRTEASVDDKISHPTQIAEAVDELWGGALRYEEEL